MKLRNSSRDYMTESSLFICQALIAFLGILLLTGVLVANPYSVQIVRFNDCRTHSNENRVRLVPISLSRSTVHDRNGTLLAPNRTIYQLEIMPEEVDDVQQTLDAPHDVVDLTDGGIADPEEECARSHRFTSIPIKVNFSEVQVARSAINQYRFPGVEAKGYKCCYCPYDSALAHVIGYASKINDRDVDCLDKEGKLANYASTHGIGRLGIECYYEDVLHDQTGYEEVEVNNRGRVIRQLREVPPQAGRDVYLAPGLKLQQYIETLLAGSRAAVVVTDPRTGAALALVSAPSYDPNPFVDGISSKGYSGLLDDPSTSLVDCAVQGVYPPASMVKLCVAVSALSTGAITRNTNLLDPGWWQPPGSNKHCRDWKKWGHGHLNITKTLEESAGTHFYQIAYDTDIDRFSEWMNKFGYGHYTGIDPSGKCSGNMPIREWKLKHFKKLWYQGDTIPVDIGRGYWTATPIQMNKTLMILINDRVAKVPHLLRSAVKDGRPVPWVQPYGPPMGDIHSGYWGIARDGMFGVANRGNGTVHKYLTSAPYKIAAKSGTTQVFGLKANKTCNAHRISERLHDHKLMTAFAFYNDPQTAVVMILENGGAGPVVGTIMRQILDHTILGDDNTTLPSENPAVTTGEDQ